MVRTSRNAKKVHRCPICKCSFFSYSENSTLEGSHRSHRNGNPNCRIELARQREDYRRAGNIDELRFPYADYVEDDEASMCDEGNHGNEIEVDEIDNDAHEEMKIGIDDLPESDEDDIEDESIDKEDVDVDSDDEYDRLRRVEDELVIAQIHVDDQEGPEDLGLQCVGNVAKEKNDPTHRSYWTNPTTELIGVRIKKRFFNHGVFTGHVQSYTSPYFYVVYVDKDSEELSIQELLPLIDVDWLSRGRNETVEYIEHEDDQKIMDAIGICTFKITYNFFLIF